MFHPNSHTLTGWLNSNGFKDIARRTAFDLDEAEFNENLTAVQVQCPEMPDHEQRDKAAYRCLTKLRKVDVEPMQKADANVPKLLAGQNELLVLQLQRMKDQEGLDRLRRDEHAELKESIGDIGARHLESIEAFQKIHTSEIGAFRQDLAKSREECVTKIDAATASIDGLTSSMIAEFDHQKKIRKIMFWVIVALIILAAIATEAHAQTLTPVNPCVVSSTAPSYSVGQRVPCRVGPDGSAVISSPAADATQSLIARISAKLNAGMSLTGTFGNRIGSVGDRLKVDVPPSQNPCAGQVVLDAPISQTATTRVVTGGPGRLAICGIRLVAATAEIISEWEGSGTNCGTGTIAHSGSTTAANGESYSANSGYQSTGLPFSLLPGNDFCVAQSGTARVSGKVWYARLP